FSSLAGTARSHGIPARRRVRMRESPLQHPVNDQVGVTAARRGEMRVLAKRQGEVAERRNRVPRLLERAEHQVREDTFLGFAGDFLGQALVVLWADVELHRARQSDAHLPLAAALLAAGTRGRRHAAMLYRDTALGQALHAQR